MTLGEYLKNARGDKTLGQISAASNIDKGYLSKIERDERKPKPEMLSKIAEAYRIEYQTLLKLCNSVPDDFIILARKVGDISTDQRDALYKLLDDTIDDVLDKLSSKEGNN